MNAITRTFKTQMMGYDQAQVDSYIEVLSSEYQTLSVEHEEMVRQAEHEARERKGQVEAIGRALVDAELQRLDILTAAGDEAQQIVSQAKEEAAMLLEMVQREVAQLKERALLEADQILGDARLELQTMTQNKRVLTTEITELYGKLRALIPASN